MKYITALFLLMAIGTVNINAVTINLWYTERGRRKKAIEKVAAAFNSSHRKINVKLLLVPFGVFSGRSSYMLKKLFSGPDIFIYSQDFVGVWAEKKIILPLDYFVTKKMRSKYFKQSLAAFQYNKQGTLWAIPRSIYSLCLYYNKKLVKKAPRTMNALLDKAKQFTNRKKGRWGFVYNMGDFYYHTMWLQGFGGRLFKKQGKRYIPRLRSKAMIQSMQYIRKIQKANVCPPVFKDGDDAKLFNSGKAMFVVSGKWFQGEISKNINYGIAQLPIIDETGRRAVPFITVEGFFMVRYCKDQKAAFKVIKYFISAAKSRQFLVRGGIISANKNAYRYSVVNNNPFAKIFRSAVTIARPMPNNPQMKYVWGPMTAALRDILKGANIRKRLKKAQQEVIRAIWKVGPKK